MINVITNYSEKKSIIKQNSKDNGVNMRYPDVDNIHLGNKPHEHVQF